MHRIKLISILDSMNWCIYFLIPLYPGYFFFIKKSTSTCSICQVTHDIPLYLLPYIKIQISISYLNLHIKSHHNIQFLSMKYFCIPVFEGCILHITVLDEIVNTVDPKLWWQIQIPFIVHFYYPLYFINFSAYFFLVTYEIQFPIAFAEVMLHDEVYWKVISICILFCLVVYSVSMQMGSSPRCPIRSHYLVCIENHLFIVGIGPIFDVYLTYIFRPVFYLCTLYLR